MAAPAGEGAATTIPGLFAERVDADPAGRCLLSKRYGRWTTHSRGDVARAAADLARGLQGLGVGPGTVALVLLAPSPVWVDADLALQALGARIVTLPVHASPAEVATARAAHGAQIALVQKAEAADAVLAPGTGAAAGAIAHVLYVEKTGLSDDVEGLVRSLEAVRRQGGELLGASEDPLAVLRSRLPAEQTVMLGTADPADPDSGVLGTSHGELVSGARGLVQALGLGPADRVLAARPLTDPVERGASVYPALLSGALLVLPESPATAPEAMWETAPSVVHLTLRQLKATAADIRVRMQSAKGLKGVLTRGWHRSFSAGVSAGEVGSPSAFWRAAVAGPVLEKLGLDQARVVVVSGDHVPVEAVWFFRHLGLRIAPAYAVPSLAGLVAVDVEGRGVDVGPPLPGLDVRVAEDGEVLVSAQRTDRAELATGDVGTLEGDRLRLVHRKDETGLLPARARQAASALERALRASPYLRDAVVTSHDGRIRVVVELMESTVARWASRRRLVFTTFASLTALPEVQELARRAVAAAAADRPGLDIAEVVVLRHSLDAMPGALTPQGRARRPVVAAMSADATRAAPTPAGIPEGRSPAR